MLSSNSCLHSLYCHFDYPPHWTNPAFVSYSFSNVFQSCTPSVSTWFLFTKVNRYITHCSCLVHQTSLHSHRHHYKSIVLLGYSSLHGDIWAGHHGMLHSHKNTVTKHSQNTSFRTTLTNQFLLLPPTQQNCWVLSCWHKQFELNCRLLQTSFQ